MNKVPKYKYFFCIMVCTFGYTYGMKRSSKNNSALIVVEKNKHDIFQQQFEKMRHVIPCFSLEEINVGFGELPYSDKAYVNYQLSKSVLFSLVLCPREIQHKILSTMLDGDHKSATEFYAKPILKAFELYKTLKPITIGNKIYSVGRLFRLKPSEVDNLIKLSEPSIAEQLIGKRHDLVRIDDCRKMYNMMPKDISDGLEWKVINEEYINGCHYVVPGCLGAWCILLKVSTLPAAMIFGCCMGGGCCCSHCYFVDRTAIEVKL